jgi:hypothetical protein
VASLVQRDGDPDAHREQHHTQHERHALLLTVGSY